MVRTRFKKVLLVAPDIFPGELFANSKYVKHISALSSVFPCLFDLNPDVVVFDYDYVGNDLEKILRRIKYNKFYNNLKIYAFKSAPNEKTDSFLKILGVNQIIYTEDLAKQQKNKSVFDYVGTILDTSILKWVANVSN